MNLQNLLKSSPLLSSQRRRELHVVSNDEVSTSTVLLRHTKLWVRILGARLCGSCTVDVEVLAIDGCDCALPSGQCLLELQVDRQHDVVAFAGEEGMFFLFIR